LLHLIEYIEHMNTSAESNKVQIRACLRSMAGVTFIVKRHPKIKGERVQQGLYLHDVGFVHSRHLFPPIVICILEGKLCRRAMLLLICNQHVHSQQLHSHMSKALQAPGLAKAMLHAIGGEWRRGAHQQLVLMLF